METSKINNNLKGKEERKIKVKEGKIEMGFVGKEGEFVKDVVSNKNGLRVKMVLTKEELQWLMQQLSNREDGRKRIEDVLGEIEKGRSKKGCHSWKPSLDSITEIPEVLEMNK